MAVKKSSDAIDDFRRRYYQTRRRHTKIEGKRKKKRSDGGEKRSEREPDESRAKVNWRMCNLAGSIIISLQKTPV